MPNGRYSLHLSVVFCFLCVHETIFQGGFFMVMKIVTGVLAILLIATLGAAAMFYLNTYKPMDADYARMKAAVSELDKAKIEIKKLKEKESSQTAWMKPVIDAVSAGLSDEIKAGHAEVLAAGDKVVV